MTVFKIVKRYLAVNILMIIGLTLSYFILVNASSVITSIINDDKVQYTSNNTIDFVLSNTSSEPINITELINDLHISYGILYMLSGIVAGISSMGYNYMIHSEVVSVGASGAIFGVVGAMLFLILFYRSSIGNISTSQIVFMIIINLYAGFASANIDNAAHIGGFIGGFIICMLLQLSMKVTKYKKRI